MLGQAGAVTGHASDFLKTFNRRQFQLLSWCSAHAGAVPSYASDFLKTCNCRQFQLLS